VISVLSNLMPQRVKQLTAACLGGDFAAARNVHQQTLELFKIMFVETNPAPVKAAMALAGLCREDVRLPLVPLADANRQKLADCLKRHGVI
jgi:4-hydroxy-tetrahydrodipicolinate synthase